MRTATFLIQSADRKGLQAGICGFLYSHDLNILHCSQYTEPEENRYFMRVSVAIESDITRKQLDEEFARLAAEMGLSYHLYFNSDPQRVALMVSKTSHCLYDLLVRAEEKTLGGEVVLVISNHPDLEAVADRFRVPYFCCPIEKGREREQEAKVLELLDHHHVDLVVLARYMRILSDDFISHYPERIINIHHAFLPAFQGGNPYQRAWKRGVKMIGATAHYATADLDEGPIIEQDVERISHENTPAELREIGRDIERRVLTRAVRAHLEHRIIVSGRRTIVL